jgi:hypothetical protein
MSVHDDITERDQYNRLTFVEFLEFIARIADGKYQDKQTLAEKL